MQCKITSLDRGLRILDILASEKEGLGVTELSRRLDADKSVVYRTLSLLMIHSYVEQELSSKKYVLGLKVMELASKKLRNIDLFSASKPYLMDLAKQTGEVVVLAVMIGDVLAYMDRAEGARAMNLSSGLGQPIPLHSTASGKSIVAFMSEDDLTRVFREKGLPAITEKTITNFSEFKRHLSEVRFRGYAVDDEETYPGVRCRRRTYSKPQHFRCGFSLCFRFRAAYYPGKSERVRGVGEGLCRPNFRSARTWRRCGGYANKARIHGSELVARTACKRQKHSRSARD